MPVNRKSLLALSLVSILALSCDRPAAFQVQDDIRASLTANQSAKTLYDWHTSENNSEALFKRWQESKLEPEIICQGFTNKNGQELSLFEEEIKSDEYRNLVAPCRDLLIEKIEKYWIQEKRKLNLSAKEEPIPTPAPIPTPLPFRFPNNRQTRDVSKGYKTFSGGLAPKEVILTFDDGPHSSYTDRILATLDSVNAKALFFAMGKNVKPRGNILRRVGNSGHSIGSHSVDHKCLPNKPACEKNNGKVLTTAEALAEIRGGHQAIKDALGWVDPFFRFPYGESSPELSNFLKNNSVGEFAWSIDSEDWRATTPLDMLTNTITAVEKRNGGIILMHDIHRKTAEVLPELLTQLYYKGYSVVLVRSANPWDRRNSKLAR